MNDARELLWRVYQDERSRCKHMATAALSASFFSQVERIAERLEAAARVHMETASPATATTVVVSSTFAGGGRDEKDAMISDLTEKLKKAEAVAEACKQEAKMWHGEAKSHEATVRECYKEAAKVTKRGGYMWEGAVPVKDAIATLRLQKEQPWRVAVDTMYATLTTAYMATDLGLPNGSATIHRQSPHAEVVYSFTETALYRIADMVRRTVEGKRNVR